MTSGISGLVRATAQKNGHNTDVIEAMIDKTKELTIDGEVLNEKGKILTLTNTEAERNFGNPPKPLLSLGTLDSTDEVLKRLGYAGARVIELHSTGAEKLASWLNLISPILLIIGVIGIYIEVKTPGVMLPGIVGTAAFALYFIGIGDYIFYRAKFLNEFLGGYFSYFWNSGNVVHCITHQAENINYL